MTIDDFITYLKVELPDGYVIEREGNAVQVYSSSGKKHGVKMILTDVDRIVDSIYRKESLNTPTGVNTITYLNSNRENLPPENKNTFTGGQVSGQVVDKLGSIARVERIWC